MFWGPVRLRERLRGQKLVVPFREDRVDGASYQLAIGKEVYVSPTADATDASTTSILRLKEGEAFPIPPGQFAFLLTEEKVKVGPREIALISIRAKIKYRGLVNVSGFHVDPGFHGRINFAVFNAGPVTVHLRRGQPIFLIWYADLSDYVESRRPPGPWQLQSEWINGISGNLHSLASLASSVTTVEQRLDRRLDAVARELAVFRVVAAVALTLLVGIGGVVVKLLGP